MGAGFRADRAEAVADVTRASITYMDARVTEMEPGGSTAAGLPAADRVH